MLLDGAGGDSVLTEGRRLARLLRAGRWRTAYREAAGQNRFFNGALPPHRELLRSARRGIRPERPAPSAPPVASTGTDRANTARLANRREIRPTDRRRRTPQDARGLLCSRPVVRRSPRASTCRFPPVPGRCTGTLRPSCGGYRDRASRSVSRPESACPSSLASLMDQLLARRLAEGDPAPRNGGPVTRCGAVASRQGTSWLGVHRAR